MNIVTQSAKGGTAKTASVMSSLYYGMEPLITPIDFSLSADKLHQLARNGSPNVREQLVSHPNLLKKTLLVLAGDSDVNVRVAVARQSWLSKPVIAKLVNMGDDRVLKVVAKQRFLTKPLIKEMIDKGSYGVYNNLGLNPFLNQNLIKFLSTHAVSPVREGVAANPNLNRDVIENLMQDPVVAVRLKLATNPSMSGKRLTEIFNQAPVKSAMKTWSSYLFEQIMNNPARDVAHLEMLYNIFPKTPTTALLFLDAKDCPFETKLELVHNFRSELPEHVVCSRQWGEGWKKSLVQYLAPQYPEMTVDMPLEWLESFIPVFGEEKF